jgi:carnosine synthase
VEDGLPTWVCELMCVRPSVHEAIAFIKQVEQSMELPIVPHNKH